MALSARTRLERLESRTAPVVGRFFRVVGGTGAPGEVENFLRAQGHSITSDDIVLHRSICRPGKSDPEPKLLSLRWAIESRTSHEDALEQL